MTRLKVFSVFLLLLSVCPSVLHASTKIQGTVTNLATGNPVAGVRVIALDANDSRVEFTETTTDSLGFYDLGLAGPGLFKVLVDLNVGSPLADQYYGGGVRHSSAGLVIINNDSDEITGTDIALPAGFSITGQITGGGVAQGNIDIDVYHEFGEPLRSLNATTGTGGFYDIGPFPNGTYVLRADPTASLEQAFLEKYYGGNSFLGSAVKIVVANGVVSGIDIDLDPAGIIKGVIEDTSGNPISGIDLDILHTSGFRLAYTGKSKADGRYWVGPLPAGSYYLKADPSKTSGHGRAIYPNSLTLDGAKLIVVVDGQILDGFNFRLPPAGTISGTLRDAQTLNALGFVDLDIFNLDGQRLEFSARTDVDGYYQLGPLPVGQYVVKGDPNDFSGYVSQYYDSAIARSGATPVSVTANTDTSDIDFLLPQGGSITGTIFDSGGSPISGVDLDVYDATGARLDASTSTSAIGTYSLGPLPDGDYYVQADPDPFFGHLTIDAFYGDVPDIESATLVTISGGTATGIDINLSYGGVISGTIRDGGGVPIPDIDLDIFDALGTRLPASATSDWDGTYIIGAVPAGNYFLKADTPDGLRYIGVFYDAVVNQASATAVTVTTSGNTTGVDFALVLGGSITGTILGPGGAPLEGIDLDVFDATGKFFDANGTTLADGSFILNGLPDGDYFIRADPDSELGQWYVGSYFGGSIDLAGASSITISGADVNGLSLALEPGGTLSGIVRGEGGVPLPGIDLDVFDSEGNWLPFSATTGVDGSYVLGPMAAANYLVKSDPPEISNYTALFFNSAAFKDAATPASVVTGSNTPGIDFDLFQGGWLSGTILAEGGGPLGDVDLDIFSAAGARMDATAKTAPDGTYTLGPVPAGDYVVRADPDKNSGHLAMFYPDVLKSADATVVTVSASNTLPGIDFDLPVAGWIEGLVTDELGAPLADIDLDLFDAVTKDRITKGGKTGVDGRYVIGPLPVQDYLVRTDPSVEQLRVREYFTEEVSLRTANPVSVTGGVGTLDVDFTLELGSFISGRVIDPRGDPIVGADIDVFRLSDLFLMDQNAKTQADGTYTIGPLPEGTYILKFDALASSVYTDVYYEGTADQVSATPIVLTAGSNITGLDSDLPEFILFPDIVIDLNGETPEVVFNFETDSGKFYHIEYSDTLLPGSWTIVTTIVGDELPANYRLAIPTDQSRRFYRIRITTF